MAHIAGSFRIGRDVELRFTQTGEPVANLALAFNYGQRNQDGHRPSQWVEASLWGKRAEALADYLVKGAQVYAVLSDPHVEQYEGKNGSGVKLVARVLDIELTSSKQQGAAQEQTRQQAPQQAPQQRQSALARQPQRQAPAPSGSGFDDFEDSIPF